MFNIEEEIIQNKEKIEILKKQNEQLIKKLQKTCLHKLTFIKHISRIYGPISSHLICKNCNITICYSHCFIGCNYTCQKR